MLVVLVCHHLSMNSLELVSFDCHPKRSSTAGGSDQSILNHPWVPSPGTDVLPCPLWTLLEPDEGTQMPQFEMGSRKILIYHEFAMMTPLIISVSRNCPTNACIHLNSFSSCLRYSKCMELMLWQSMVRKMYRSVTRLLQPSRKTRSAKCFFCPMLGLLAWPSLLQQWWSSLWVNLGIMRQFLICMQDQCWSHMLVNQIIGRAWRLGQTEVVVVYNLVCDQTVDCLMMDYALGKGSTLEQFLASRYGKDWKVLCFFMRYQPLPCVWQISKNSFCPENLPLRNSLQMWQEQNRLET